MTHFFLDLRLAASQRGTRAFAGGLNGPYMPWIGVRREGDAAMQWIWSVFAKRSARRTPPKRAEEATHAE